MDIYFKTCKKYTECTHPKTLVFFNKINDDYDLKQLIFFLTDVFYKST